MTSLRSGAPATETTARLEHLGVQFHKLDLNDLNRLVAEAIASDSSVVIANHNLHSVAVSRRDPEMRRFYDEATWTHVDGMGLVFTARLAGLRLGGANRVTYVDWIWPLMRLAASRGWRVFHLGGAPGVGEIAVEKLKAELPELDIESHHGYFDAVRQSEENRGILDMISSYRPNLLLVGMGMPRQEHWILHNRADLPAQVVLPCGACFDYVAGKVPTPPRWMGRVGLEWLFRLGADPRRLARRYLVEPFTLVGPLLKEIATRSSRSGNASRRGSDRPEE